LTRKFHPTAVQRSCVDVSQKTLPNFDVGHTTKNDQSCLENGPRQQGRKPSHRRPVVATLLKAVSFARHAEGVAAADCRGCQRSLTTRPPRSHEYERSRCATASTLVEELPRDGKHNSNYRLLPLPRRFRFLAPWHCEPALYDGRRAAMLRSAHLRTAAWRQ
jgi:hypothetical protein